MSILRLPPGGLDNPTFEALRPDQCLNVILIWREPITEDHLATAVEAMQAWFDDSAVWEGCVAEGERQGFKFQTSFSTASLIFTLANTVHPQEPLRTLLRRLRELGLDTREELFGIIEWTDDDQEITCPERDAPETAQFGSIEEHWDACFDLGGPQPASEPGADAYGDGAEMRLCRLHVPGLRICHPTLTPNFLPPDERAAEVWRAVDAAVHEVFDELQPPRRRDDPPGEPTKLTFLDREGAPAETAERIFRGGRAGYSLAVWAADLRVDYPRQLRGGWAHRYREHELLIAMASAIRSLAIEPVVMWKRFVDADGAISHYELQLWEPIDSPASARARAEVTGWRERALQAGDLAAVPTVEPRPRARPAIEPATASDVAGAADLPEGSLVARGPGAWHLALVPTDDVAEGHTLWALGNGEARPIEAPASGFYDRASRCAFVDETRCVLATSCMVRAVDLAAASARDVLLGAGFEQVVALAEGRVLVRGSAGESFLFPDEPDVITLCEVQERDVPDEPEEVEEPPALYLIDTDANPTGDPADDSALVQTIPCRAGELSAVRGGTIVVVWTPHESAWRTAVLALEGGRLHLLQTLREAMPDTREIDGRLISSTCVELLNAEAARDRLEVDDDEEPDLEELDPDRADD